MKGQGYLTRYSERFKQQVVAEIEQKGLTQSEAKRKYGIAGSVTIHQWIKRYGKTHLLSRIVRIEMPEETTPQDIIKQLKNEKQQLESALAQAQLKILTLETMMEVAEKELKIPIKKKYGNKPSTSSGKKQK